MKRSATLITLALALSMSGAAFATKQSAAKKGSGETMVTCPIMKQKLPKSKATAVKTQSGKTVWVCCKSCVAPAKKLK
jgi:hypothetical protein